MQRRHAGQLTKNVDPTQGCGEKEDPNMSSCRQQHVSMINMLRSKATLSLNITHRPYKNKRIEIESFGGVFFILACSGWFSLDHPRGMVNSNRHQNDRRQASQPQNGMMHLDAHMAHRIPPVDDQESTRPNGTHYQIRPNLQLSNIHWVKHIDVDE